MIPITKEPLWKTGQAEYGRALTALGRTHSETISVALRSYKKAVDEAFSRLQAVRATARAEHERARVVACDVWSEARAAIRGEAVRGERG